MAEWCDAWPHRMGNRHATESGGSLCAGIDGALGMAARTRTREKVPGSPAVTTPPPEELPPRALEALVSRRL